MNDGRTSLCAVLFSLRVEGDLTKTLIESKRRDQYPVTNKNINNNFLRG